jgi:hypothetical protein
MTQKIIIILSILFFSACHPQIKSNSCTISTDIILSCIASSAHLSEKEITTKLELLTSPDAPEADTTRLNKVICLSLHNNATKSQLQKGDELLQETLTQTECKQQNISGLLYILQGKLDLYNKYLDKNWDFYLKKKKINKEQETDKLELKNEVTSYQRRIKDLEQQVQKLKELELMLDKKSPQ